MGFDLQEACKNCQPATIKKYKRDILRLFKLRNPKAENIPETSAWLKEEIIYKKYKAMPLNQRRAYSVAGVKAGQAYSLKDNKKWYKAMVDDVNAYKDHRKLQLKSDDEKKNWPKEGIAVIKKIATEFKREIRRDLQEPTISSLYLYSQYIILKFYSQVALRNDLAEVQLGSGPNHLTRSKGVYTLHMSKFKVSEKVGAVDIVLSKALSTAISKYVKFRSKLDLDHTFLVINAKGGKLSKKGLGLILQKLTKKYTGKSFGTRLLRILKATENRKVLDKALKISKEMLHKNLAQTVSYARKD